MITSLLLTPLITAVLLLCIPGTLRVPIRLLAVLGGAITVWKAIGLFGATLPGIASLQHEQLLPWVSVGGFSIAYHVGADGLNIGLILATAVVGFSAICVSWDIERQTKLYYLLLLLIITGAIGAFASLDLFFFYFFNELALVPTFIMIGVWGRGAEKTRAAFKITLYLTLGAMTALAGLIALYVQSGATSLDVVELQKHLAANPLPASTQIWLFPLLLFGFGTLVGLFPFHSWAPEGYAAAPTATAMLHAGILKKAGLYALIRVAWPFFPEGVAAWMPVLLILTLGNLVFCGFVAMRQKDLNLLLGNSSLAHMGFAFLGLASLTTIGISGTVLVMVAHAFLAALGFALSGFLYARTGTLEMARFGGLLQRLPFIGAVMIACFMAGCGLPGFANFAGEVSVLFGAWKSSGTGLHWLVVAAAWGGLVIGAVYMLRAIRQVLHGELATEWKTLEEFRTAEELPAGEAAGHEASTAGTTLTWFLHSLLGGTLWACWRRFPYLLLLGALLWFGFAPYILTTRIEPVVKNIVKAATTRVAQPGVAAPVVAVRPQP